MKLKYKPQDGALVSFTCYVKAHNKNVVLMRIDRLKNVYTYDKEQEDPIPDIKKRSHKSYPNCHIIIDNRQNYHQIAIEIEPSAWRDTRKVRDILQSGLNEYLKRYGFEIAINAKTMPGDYWELTQRKRKVDHIALKRMTIGFDTSNMTPEAEAIIRKTCHLKSLMTMIAHLGAGKGTLDLQSQSDTDEMLRKKLTDIKHIVELCGEGAYWLSLSFSDGVTYRCGDNIRAELPMNPPSIMDYFVLGIAHPDLSEEKGDMLFWLNWVKEETKKYNEAG